MSEIQDRGAADDYDDMHHAFGRPLSPNVDCYRNYYCVGVNTPTAERFGKLGWWDFGRTINGGRDGIFHVNGAGKQALAEWMEGHRYEHGKWVPRDALAAAAEGGDVEQAPGEAPQSGGDSRNAQPESSQ